MTPCTPGWGERCRHATSEAAACTCACGGANHGATKGRWVQMGIMGLEPEPTVPAGRLELEVPAAGRKRTRQGRAFQQTFTFAWGG